MPQEITDALLATVLGFLGLFLWLGAIGFFLVMLARAGALIVLVATGPIAAAGLASGFSRTWFWKSFRWFHAAAFTPVLVALVLGLGISVTSEVVSQQQEGVGRAVGTAIPGVFLICIAAFSPLALFKLLACVDPGTSSGAAMRAGFEAQGGLRGLAGRSSSTSDAASSVDSNGRSRSETSTDADANQRAGKATGALASRVGSAFGPQGAVVGAAVGAGVGAMVSAGTRAASVAADLSNQMGVGHNTYLPDFQASRPRGDRHRVTHPEQRGLEADTDVRVSPAPAEPILRSARGGAGGEKGSGTT